jgi:hypothetical protein
MNGTWIDVTDSFIMHREPKEHTDDMCDWGPGCNNSVQFRVTLKDRHQRYLCKSHLISRLESCKYTHKKIEKLIQEENA